MEGHETRGGTDGTAMYGCTERRVDGMYVIMDNGEIHGYTDIRQGLFNPPLPTLSKSIRLRSTQTKTLHLGHSKLIGTPKEEPCMSMTR